MANSVWVNTFGGMSFNGSTVAVGFPLSVTGGSITASGQIIAPFGASASPGFSFPDLNTGWYGSAGVMRCSAGGVANAIVITGTAASFAGTLDASVYSSLGTSGVTTFGPAAVASITVKGGIITAIS